MLHIVRHARITLLLNIMIIFTPATAFASLLSHAEFTVAEVNKTRAPSNPAQPS